MMMTIGKKIQPKKIPGLIYLQLNWNMEKVLDHGKEELVAFNQEQLIFTITVKCQISTS